MPEKWKGLIGEYGWDHDILYVFEKNACLNVLIEWTEFDALTQTSEDVFQFPSSGLSDGERAVFTRDATGEATQVQVSGSVFKRRPVGGVSGGIFRLPPVKNLDELRKQALADHPPVETVDFHKPDLVEPRDPGPNDQAPKFATQPPTISLEEYPLFTPATARLPPAARGGSTVACTQAVEGDGLMVCSSTTRTAPGT